MVDVLGHLAMGMFAALPVWVVWNRRPALAFLGCVLLTSMVPDIDLYLPWATHHGLTHTLLFAGIVAFAGAGVAVLAAPTTVRQWSPWIDSPAVPLGYVFAFAVAGLFLGGVVHVVFDMLSTSTRGLVVNPFWPFFQKPFSVYLITSFSEPRWNAVPFTVAVVSHTLAYRRVALD